MAQISKGIKLSYKAEGSADFTELTNLQSIPDLGGSAEKIDVTTLADASKKSINGIKDYGDLAFTFIYEKAQFSTLNAIDDACQWKVEIPGDDIMTATFEGEPSVTFSGVGVNAALTYNLSIALISEIEFDK